MGEGMQRNSSKEDFGMRALAGGLQNNHGVEGLGASNFDGSRTGASVGIRKEEAYERIRHRRLVNGCIGELRVFSFRAGNLEYFS